MAVAAEKTGDAARRDSAPRRGTRWQHLKLKIICRKRATNYMALLSCAGNTGDAARRDSALRREPCKLQVTFRKRATNYRALLWKMASRYEVADQEHLALAHEPRWQYLVSYRSLSAKEPLITGLFCGK